MASGLLSTAMTALQHAARTCKVWRSSWAAMRVSALGFRGDFGDVSANEQRGFGQAPQAEVGSIFGHGQGSIANLNEESAMMAQAEG